MHADGFIRILRTVHAHDLCQPHRLDSLAVTQMNTDSSRSHAIVEFTISSTRSTRPATTCAVAAPPVSRRGSRGLGIASDDFSTLTDTLHPSEEPNNDGTTNGHHGGTSYSRSARGCSDGTATVQTSDDGGGDTAVVRTRAKLSLVDLAGSEKGGAGGDRERNGRGPQSSRSAFSQSQSGLPSQGRDERAAQERERARINSSLHALSNCISCLGKGRRSHIPFRDSPLTR